MEKGRALSAAWSDVSIQAAQPPSAGITPEGGGGLHDERGMHPAGDTCDDVIPSSFDFAQDRLGREIRPRMEDRMIFSQPPASTAARDDKRSVICGQRAAEPVG